MLEKGKFQEADKRLKKLEQLAITSDEDGDLAAADDAFAKFEDLLDHMHKRWPSDKYFHFYKDLSFTDPG